MIILYSLLLFSISLGVLTKITLLPTVNVYLFDLLTILIIIFSGKYIYKFIAQNYMKLLPFILFFGVSSIGLLFYTKNFFEFFSSFSYLLRITAYLLLVIPLRNFSKKQLSMLKKVMLGTGSFFIASGYVQYFFYPNLRNLFYLGWDEHLYRLFSTFLDPNFAGVYIVFIVMLYTAFVFKEFAQRNKFTKAVLLSGYLFYVPSLFLTYSRSSYVMFLVSFFVFLILTGKRKLILLFLLLFISGVVILPKNFGGEGVKLLRTASVVARADSYQNSVKIVISSPVWGVGFDSLRFSSYRLGLISKADYLTSHAAAGIPNSYLFILATTGITGFCFFSYFLYLLFQKIIQERKSDLFFFAYITAGMTGVLVDSLFENSLFYAQIFLLIIVSIGIFFGMSAKSMKAKSSARP